MIDAIILSETLALVAVYGLIFYVAARSGRLDRYFRVFIGTLALSSAWLLVTELSLVVDYLPQIAERGIRPIVNRAICLFGGVYFLAGAFLDTKTRGKNV